MVDTDDTRCTTDDGRQTTDDGRQTMPWVLHKLPTGELKKVCSNRCNIGFIMTKNDKIRSH